MTPNVLVRLSLDLRCKQNHVVASINSPDVKLYLGRPVVGGLRACNQLGRLHRGHTSTGAGTKDPGRHKEPFLNRAEK